MPTKAPTLLTLDGKVSCLLAALLGSRLTDIAGVEEMLVDFAHQTSSLVPTKVVHVEFWNVVELCHLQILFEFFQLRK